MPKLWSDTIKAHRSEVRNAILDAAALLSEQGLRAVTMSKVAEEAGIGRATLYKYFSGVEAILLAWHERQVAQHLEHLKGIHSKPGDAKKKLESVLLTYALITHQHHGSELAALLHQGEHSIKAHQQLNELIQELLSNAVEAGSVRSDISLEELASYCLHALAAASKLSSKAAVQRLVAVILDGLRA
jgi:AcrR family transcriptional regulator